MISKERRAEIERELRNILNKYSENVRDNALHGYSFVWPDLNQTVQAIISQIEKAEVEKEKEIERLKQDAAITKAIPKILEAIGDRKWDKPVLFFKYPKRNEFAKQHLLKWTDMMSHYFHVAGYYEKQERGGCCSIDRAYSDWLKPECDKMYDYLLSGKGE